MANETSALRSQPLPGRVVEHDYQTFCDAVGASVRGRAFLQEYARRNRHADTEVVLAALARLESVARSQKAAPEAERIRQDLRALLGTIHSARPQIDSTPGAIKSATLAALIEFVQARIEALVSPTNAPLAAVPEPEQRELPIPQPGSTAHRTIALVEPLASVPQNPRVPAHARNFDPDVPSNDAPHAPKTIPAVDFIETLFEKANAEVDADAVAAKDSEKAAAKKARKAAAKTPTAAEIEHQILPPPVAIAAPAPSALATVLPPVELTPIATPTSDADTAGTVEFTGRTSSATAAAIDASAAAIDEIVAAAEAAMALEAGRAQAPASEPAFVEINVARAEPVAPSEPPAARAQLLIAAVDIEPVANVVAEVVDVVSKPAPTAASEPSVPVVDNALSAIMTLSEEERLALFT